MTLGSISPSVANSDTDPQGCAMGAPSTGGMGRGVEAQALTRTASDTSGTITEGRFLIMI